MTIGIEALSAEDIEEETRSTAAAAIRSPDGEARLAKIILTECRACRRSVEAAARTSTGTPARTAAADVTIGGTEVTAATAAAATTAAACACTETAKATATVDLLSVRCEWSEP